MNKEQAVSNYDKGVQALKAAVELQSSHGNWDANPYMHGMANGMKFALAIFTGGEPEFLDAPDAWQDDVPSDGEPKHIEICPYCNKEISDNMVQQGGFHLGCYETEIDVWFVSLPESPKSGYFEKDVEELSEMLKNAEEHLLIERQKMTVGKYYSLADFQGF